MTGSELTFSKWHGLRNDYVLLSIDGDLDLNAAAVAREACHRRSGIGADGLLLCRRTGRGEASFRIVNADGSDAELCGNGLRCAAAWLADIDSVSSVQMCSAVGRHEAVVEPAGHWRWVVEMDLGVVQRASSVVVHGRDGWRINVKRASTGNPHAVVFEEHAPSDARLASIATEVARSEHFAGGVNVHLARRSSDGSIDMCSHERGVGPVEACATGAVAVALLAGGGRVKVRMPGGALDVQVDPNSGAARMRGPACRVATGLWVPGGKVCS